MALKLKIISGSATLSADGLTFTNASSLTVTTDQVIKTPQYYFEMTFDNGNYKHLSFDVFSDGSNRYTGTFGFDVDHIAKTITYYLDGSLWRTVPYTANTIPQIKFYINESGANTANLGDTPYKYTSPKGFKKPDTTRERTMIEYKDKVYSIKGNQLIEFSGSLSIPYVEYGMPSETNLNVILSSKEYFLQGTTTVQLTEKPLSLMLR